MNTDQIKMYENILAIMSYLLFVLLFGKTLDSINPINVEIIDIINIIGTTIFSVIFVKSLLSPYLVINSNTLSLSVENPNIKMTLEKRVNF
jgi:hypothetical protein